MNQRIGYALVSMDDLHLELQRVAFGQEGCGIAYEDAVVARFQARRSLNSAAKSRGTATPWSRGGWLFRSMVRNTDCRIARPLLTILSICHKQIP